MHPPPGNPHTTAIDATPPATAVSEPDPASPTDASATATRWPDLLVVGAPKAGTTSLHKALGRHLDLHMSQPKEPGYLAHLDEHELPAAYDRLFADASPDQRRGESSTVYSERGHTGVVAERVARFAPACRMVYILREPLARAYSHYRQALYSYERENGELLRASFEHYVENIDPSPIDNSLYASRIRDYLAHRPADRLTTLRFETLVADPRPAVARVLRDLGLPEPDAVNLPTSNTSAERDRKLRLRRIGRRLGAPSDGGKTWLYRETRDPRVRLARRLSRSWLGRRLCHAAGPAPLKARTRRDLARRFLDSLDELEPLVDFDLADWRATLRRAAGS